MKTGAVLTNSSYGSFTLKLGRCLRFIITFLHSFQTYLKVRRKFYAIRPKISTPEKLEHH
jgi:hypothetical protein